MVNVGNPAQAFAQAALPNDGVGLARIEFVISSAIGVHPLALTRFETLPPGKVRDQIAARCGDMRKIRLLRRTAGKRVSVRSRRRFIRGM